MEEVGRREGMREGMREGEREGEREGVCPPDSVLCGVLY